MGKGVLDPLKDNPEHPEPSRSGSRLNIDWDCCLEPRHTNSARGTVADVYIYIYIHIAHALCVYIYTYLYTFFLCVYIYIYIDLLLRRLITSYLRGSDKKVEQKSKADLNTTKVSQLLFVIWGRFHSLWRQFFETFSVDFGLSELAWEPVGRQDLNMCDKGAKITLKLRLWGSFGGVWGPKVAPKGGQDGRQWPRTGPPEGSGQSFWGPLGDFTAKVTISWNVWKT